MKTALVKIDVELKKEIKIAAAKKEMLMQDLIDIALREYLKKDK